MASVPIYKRVTDNQVKPQAISISNGAIRNLDMISKDAHQMAQGLQQDAEKTYLTEFQNNAYEQIAKISERNQANPDQMIQEFQAAYAGITKNASPLLQEKLKLNFEVLTRPQISQAMELKNKIANDKLKESSLITLNQSLKGLEKNAIQLLSSNSSVAYDASQAAQMQMLNMKTAMEQTDSRGVPLFSAEQRVRYVEDANKQMMISGIKGWFDQQGDKNAAMKAVLSGQKTFKFYDAQGNLTQEKVPYDELDFFSFDKVKDYMESEVKHQFAEIKRAQKDAAINNFFSGDQQLDPGSKKQIKALNAYFDRNIKPTLNTMNPVQKSQAITEFIERSHIVPEDIKGLIRTTTRHGTPEQQAWSADLISKIAERRPESLEDFKDSDISYAKAMGNMLRYGLTPVEAVERLRKEFDPLNQEVIKRRKEDARYTTPQARIEIEKSFNRGWFSGGTNFPQDKNITDAQEADYRNIYEQEYIRLGDSDLAKESAAIIFKKTYSLSNINKRNEVMRYAPEKYYSLPNTKNDWMRKQLVDTVKSIDQYKEVDETDIGVISDSITAREVQAGIRPSYLIRIKKENGYEIARTKSGQLARAYFDPVEEVDAINKKIDIQKNEIIEVKRQSMANARTAKYYYDNPSDIERIHYENDVLLSEGL